MEESPEHDFSWHAAHSPHVVRPGIQTVISEAHVVYYGVQKVHKPRRLVYTSAENTVPECSTQEGLITT
jgi:hypothetical protein